MDERGEPRNQIQKNEYTCPFYSRQDGAILCAQRCRVELPDAEAQKYYTDTYCRAKYRHCTVYIGLALSEDAWQRRAAEARRRRRSAGEAFAYRAPRKRGGA